MEHKKFGLIGRNISYSFSRGYFSEKFEKLGLENHSYVNFDLETIDLLEEIIQKKENGLLGMNVTIPYKQEVQPFLTQIDVDAQKIGAVNTIKLTKEGGVEGYNTDVYGFKESLKPLLKEHHKKALILGTGGASKAVAFALEQLGIEYVYVSRTAKGAIISYENVTAEIIASHTVIINCTPLGTSPNIEQRPEIPYSQITNKHLLYDLIYNPSETTFLKLGKEQGATIKNGLEMLQLQAEKSWEIWNS